VHALKKEANWLPFVTLKADKDPLQLRQLAELHSRKNIDLLLQAQSHFLKAHDHEVNLALIEVNSQHNFLARPVFCTSQVTCWEDCI